MKPFQLTVLFASLLISSFARAETYGGVEFPLGARSFADRVVSFSLNGATGVSAPYDNPALALGVPDFSGTQSATYLALGNTPAGGTPSELVLAFEDNALIDVEGPDLYIFEVGPTVEAVDLAVSVDGTTWYEVGRIEGSTRGVDLAQHNVPTGARFRFVRLRDIIDGDTSGPPYAGPDIDAVGAIGSVAINDGCVPVVAEAGEFDGRLYPSGARSFADRVVRYRPGTGVKAPYDDPSTSLGAPDTTNISNPTYVALGEPSGDEAPAELIVFFRSIELVDQEGVDLYIHEIGPQVESTYVSVSVDGSEWYELGRIEGSTRGIDLSEHPAVPAGARFRYVRLISDEAQNQSASPYAGPDIDAIGFVNACAVAPTADLDGDGIPDHEDACPADPGADADGRGGDGCAWSTLQTEETSGCGCSTGPTAASFLLFGFVAVWLAAARRRV